MHAKGAVYVYHFSLFLGLKIEVSASEPLHKNYLEESCKVLSCI